MKVTAVEPLIVGGKFVLVRVQTGDGVVGIGECSPMNAPAIAKTVGQTVAPLVIGEDLMAIETLMERIAIATYTFEGRAPAGRPGTPLRRASGGGRKAGSGNPERRIR